MLNANEFLKELYARLDSQNVNYKGQISVADFTDNALAKMFIEQYEPFLPKDKNAKIKYRAFEGYFPKTVEPELIVSSKKT